MTESCIPLGFTVVASVVGMSTTMTRTVQHDINP